MARRPDEDPYGTIPMFEVPKPYRPPKREMAYPAWRTLPKNAKRMSCDDCIIEIATGQRVYVSEPARFARMDETRTAYYCSHHTRARKAEDGVE